MIPGLCFFSSSVLHDVNIFVEERLRDLKSAHIVQSTEQLVLFFLFFFLNSTTMCSSSGNKCFSQSYNN